MAHPPFELTTDGDVVRGRGASDDKGPVYVVLKTVQAFLAQEGRLPVNVKFLFEGEEEIGSPHLEQYLTAHREELAADLVISADGAMWRPGEPSLSLGSKGLVSLDIVVEGAAADLHSGRYGGTVANPLHALATVIASLHRPDGSVAVPGFYDGIPALTAARRAEIAAVPFDEQRYAAELGVSEPLGEAGYSTLERLWERPTLEVNGVTGGGKYTVIPHVAIAHVSARLVPGQDPAAMLERIAGHVRGLASAGVRAWRAARPGPGARVHDRGGSSRDRGRDRRAAGGVPGSGRAAREDRRHAPGRRPVRAGAGGEDALLLVLDRGREPARTERVHADPQAARGNAGLGGALAAAGRQLVIGGTSPWPSRTPATPTCPRAPCPRLTCTRVRPGAAATRGRP